MKCEKCPPPPNKMQNAAAIAISSSPRDTRKGHRTPGIQTNIPRAVASTTRIFHKI